MKPQVSNSIDSNSPDSSSGAQSIEKNGAEFGFDGGLENAEKSEYLSTQPETKWSSGGVVSHRGVATSEGGSSADSQSKVNKSNEQSTGSRGLNPLFLIISIIILGGLVAFGALPRLNHSQTLIEEKKKELSQAPWVSTTNARASKPIEEFVLPGSTQAILDAPIYARINGYIKNVYVNIGDNVRSGQLLADIDVPDIDKQVQMGSDAVRQAKANLRNALEAENRANADAETQASLVAKARTDLEYARVQLERYKELATQGAVSLEERDTRQTNYDGARATLEAALSSQQASRAAVKSAKAAVQVAKAAMEAAQSQHEQYAATQSFKKVLSPFDGVVTARNLDPGALVTMGSNATNTIMFDIARTDELKVNTYVPEQFVKDIHVGQTAMLTFQAFPGQEFVGKVAYIAGGLSSTSRTLQVELHVPNKNHRLLPGMYAQVHFNVPAEARLAIVPGSAVQARADGNYVFTVDEQDRAHLRKVEIRTDLGSEVEVSSGIAVGDTVVLSPSDDIVDGILVNSTPITEKDKAAHDKSAVK